MASWTRYIRLCVAASSCVVGCTGAVQSPSSEKTPGRAAEPAVMPGARPSGPAAPPSPPADPLKPATCDPGGEVLRPPRVWRLTERQLQQTVDGALAQLSAGAVTKADPPFTLDDGGKDAFVRTAASLQLGGTVAEQLVEAAATFATRHAVAASSGIACSKAATLTAACAEQLAATFLRAFTRGQAPDDVVADHKDLVLRTATALGKERAIEAALAAALASPYTLFRWEIGRGQAQHRGQSVRSLDAGELAAALAFTLKNAPPTPAFIDELARADLNDVAGVERLVRRHLGGPEGMREFLERMFQLGPVNPLNAGDPAFTAAVAEQLRVESSAWLDERLTEGKASLQGLLTGETVFASAATAFVYGLDKAALGARPTRVTAPAGQRAGLLTQPSFLAGHAFVGFGDPVHRGKVVRANLFCATLPPPPPEAANVMVPTDPSLSNRARFEQHQRRPECAICHKLMDELGFALERYDGAGRYKTTYPNRTAIDDAGFIHGTDVEGPVRGGSGLAERLLTSADVRRCVASHLFRFAVGEAPTAGDACTMAALQQRFGADSDVLRTTVELVLSPSFRLRKER